MIKLLKDRLRYLRQAVRRAGRETDELLYKKIEVIAILQELGEKVD